MKYVMKHLMTFESYRSSSQNIGTYNGPPITSGNQIVDPGTFSVASDGRIGGEFDGTSDVTATPGKIKYKATLENPITRKDRKRKKVAKKLDAEFILKLKDEEQN